MYNIYWYRSYTQRFLSCFFIFTSFNTTQLILLLKVILIKKVTNSGGLMLVSRWAGVNALVEIKFRSSIHLLRQYLLAQSRQWKHQMNVWNLLKVKKNKDTRLMSLMLFWCPYC